MPGNVLHQGDLAWAQCAIFAEVDADGQIWAEIGAIGQRTVFAYGGAYVLALRPAQYLDFYCPVKPADHAIKSRRPSRLLAASICPPNRPSVLHQKLLAIYTVI